MSHHKFGNADEVNKYHNQLNDAMKLDAFKDDEECLSFLNEVNNLFPLQKADISSDGS